MPHVHSIQGCGDRTSIALMSCLSDTPLLGMGRGSRGLREGDLAHLLLDACIEPPQRLLEALVLRLEGGTALHVLEGLVQLPQVLQGLASPIQGLDVRGVDVNG